MSRRDDLRRAGGLYRKFREEPVRNARAVNVDLPRAVAQIGTCEFIGYMTTHRGVAKFYIHEFAEGSRPHLYAGTRRGQLYLIGGRFKVTELGITDLTPDGKVVHARRRFNVTRR
jgi:hypothetical protein